MAAAASLICAAGASGQDLGNKVKVVYSLDPAPHVTATNEYASPLVALAVDTSDLYTPNEARDVVWYDPAIYLAQAPHLEPGQSSRLIGAMAAGEVYAPLRVMAAEFEDGTTVGDPYWLRELHARREAAYKEIDAVSAVLDQALARHESDAKILSGLEAMRRAVLDNWHRDPQTRDAAALVITVAQVRLGLGPVGHKAVEVDPQTTIPSVVAPLLTRWRATLRHYDPSLN